MSVRIEPKENQLKNKKSPTGYQKVEKDINSLSHEELAELYEKTQAILNNQTIKLPDGGAKLKAKIEQIGKVLTNAKNTANLTQKVSELSLHDCPNSRKEILHYADNAKEAHTLLRPHSEPSSNTRAARIISLEESIQIQDSQQKDIKEANMKKRMESVTKSMKVDSLADELSNTMGRLRLNPETRVPRPDDDGSSDGEGDGTDSMDDDSDDDDDDLLYVDDDEGFDEEEDGVEQPRR
ncbi:unnamed protein product [Rhizopus stolonifer]